MAATAEQRAKMTAAVEAVRKMLEAAEAEVRRRELLGAASAVSPVAGFLNWAIGSEVAQSLAGNVQHARHLFGQWSGLWRTWAERGTDDKDKLYPLAHWFRIGEDLAKQCAHVTKAYVDSSMFAIVKDTVAQTGADVASGATAGAVAVGEALEALKEGAEKLAQPWPLSWKLAAGGAGAVAVLAAGGYFLNALPFLPRRPGR